MYQQLHNKHKDQCDNNMSPNTSIYELLKHDFYNDTDEVVDSTLIQW